MSDIREYKHTSGDSFTIEKDANSNKIIVEFKEGNAAAGNGDATKVTDVVKAKIDEVYNAANEASGAFSDSNTYSNDEAQITYIKEEVENKAPIDYSSAGFNEEDLVAAIKEKFIQSQTSTGGKAKRSKKSAKKGKKSRGMKGKRGRRSAKKGRK